jgi:uncharacterized membrane protein YeaQ/YmgE (transglycosylase-associated protein family)
MSAELPVSQLAEALAIIGVVGGVFGALGGFFGSRRGFLGSILVGVIGGISAAAIARIAGVDPVMPVEGTFSLIWAAVGGLVLGFVVSKSS